MSHIRRFKCTEPVCQYPPFVSPQALQRHVKKCHTREISRTSIRQRMSGSQHRMAPTPAPRLWESQTKPDLAVENGSSSLYTREAASTGHIQEETSAQPSLLQPGPAQHPTSSYSFPPHGYAEMSPEKFRLTPEPPQTAHDPPSHYTRTELGLGGSSRAEEKYQYWPPPLTSLPEWNVLPIPERAGMPTLSDSGYVASRTPGQPSPSPNNKPPGVSSSPLTQENLQLLREKMRMANGHASSTAVHGQNASPHEQTKITSPDLEKEEEPRAAPKLTFMCIEPGCVMADIGFPTEEAIRRHLLEVHPLPDESPRQFMPNRAMPYRVLVGDSGRDFDYSRANWRGLKVG